jgi:DNA polymerase III epsilon subunit-like protein
MPADALAVHGLTAEFFADKPLFGAVADEFLASVGDASLVAHNAGFDIAFFHAELKRAAKQPKLANSLPQAWRWPLARRVPGLFYEYEIA